MARIRIAAVLLLAVLSYQIDARMLKTADGACLSNLLLCLIDLHFRSHVGLCKSFDCLIQVL